MASSEPVATAPVAPTAVAKPTAPPPLVGVLAAKNMQVVAAQIDGRVLHVSVTSGQRIHAGEPVAELDSSLLDDRARQASAAVEVARAETAGMAAEVSEAQRQLALERRMFNSGASAEESVRLARAQLQRASAGAARAGATLREAEAAREAINVEVGRSRVVAPIDGVVSLVKVQPGEVVGPGAVIARVFDPSGLTVRFQVTHDRRKDVEVGTRVVLAVAGNEVTAEVKSVSADLEPPLDFAVAEADVVGNPPDMPVGSVGDVRIVR
jgi:RND family efflux transporter MFP subunit